MSVLDDTEQVACKSCGAAIEAAELKCIGMVNGQMDLLLDCPDCGATHNGFISFSDFQVVT